MHLFLFFIALSKETNFVDLAERNVQVNLPRYNRAMLMSTVHFRRGLWSKRLWLVIGWILIFVWWQSLLLGPPSHFLQMITMLSPTDCLTKGRWFFQLISNTTFSVKPHLIFSDTYFLLFWLTCVFFSCLCNWILQAPWVVFCGCAVPSQGQLYIVWPPSCIILCCRHWSCGTNPGTGWELVLTSCPRFLPDSARTVGVG